MKISRYPLSSRSSKVALGNLARSCPCDLRPFLDSLPDVLAARQLRGLVAELERACRERLTTIFMLGGHVVKCGLSPLLIRLMEQGMIGHLAMNGAAAIHDFELAHSGATSEDVAEGLRQGSFGMAEETGVVLNGLVSANPADGYGTAVGRAMHDYPHAEISLLAQAHRLGVAATVHTTVGAEIIYQHPECDPRALGEASYRDFHKLTESVCQLSRGGVVVNLGSAVVMPEVFLKAFALARNRGYQFPDFAAANFDMQRHYRPTENVLRRPGGRAYEIIGPHEIMIPLLCAALQAAKFLKSDNSEI